MSTLRGQVQKQLARPAIELSWGWRVFLWAFRSEASYVLFFAMLFLIFYGLQILFAGSSSGFRGLLLGAFALLIGGVFLGIVIVTEDDVAYKHSGSRIRMTCRLIAGIAIALMGNVGVEGVVLGYFGIYWVKYC